MQTLSFDVHGMTCGGCVGSVQRAISKLDGVSDVKVTLQPGAAIVRADLARVTPIQIQSEIAKLGYTVKAHPVDFGEKILP